MTDAQARAVVLAKVDLEMTETMERHPAMNSHHEAYGVLLEEVDEFWDEVKKKASKRQKARTREELVQVAAMACRAIIDLNLLELV